MNILVTGSNGQLGSELRKMARVDRLHHWHFTDVAELDITKQETVEGFFEIHEIEVCINCAAYTAVDKAEDEPELADRINALAVGVLADACKKYKALLVHISTDYVFNGENFQPYEENDPVSPISAYGKTKAHGEAILATHACHSVILRTSWLYSATGNNFVKTMRRLGGEREELKVVCDQVGTPTWAFDLAWAILLVVDHYDGGYVKEIYHFSNEGAISWYDFAKAIMEMDAIHCKVTAIPSSAYPVKTKRPFYSVLSKEKFKNKYQVQVPYWKDSLLQCMNELHGQEQAK
jgi:dTDP-4-dehydrorhamnose reductase